MLSVRIITALLIAPPFVFATILLPLDLFALLYTALACLALWEWVDLSGIGLTGRFAYLIAACAGLFGIWLLQPWWIILLLALTFAWIVVAANFFRPQGTAPVKPPTVLIAGIVTTFIAWLGLVVLKRLHGGEWLIIWLFAVIWAADIGAYFAGRRFGKRKLAPAISPGKTWEGVAGGVALALAVAILGGLLGALPVSWAVLLMAILVPVSIVGDLFESAVKRSVHVKDSGGLLPGHGGVLDRIDSMLTTLPLLALLATAIPGVPPIT